MAPSKWIWAARDSRIRRVRAFAGIGRPGFESAAIQHSRCNLSTITRKTAPAIKTQGEIEASICEGIARFEQEFMGRGPKDIRAHLIGDLLVVRLQGVLTAAEQHLVQSLPPEKGRDLLKQVRTQLIETARPVLESLVQEATGLNAISLHHDISTSTGEEVVLFTLTKAPHVREMQRK
jgi:uncharacterized protein YbcI